VDGRLTRNALFILIGALWIWLSVDLNRSLLRLVPQHETVGQIVYYLAIPAIVMAVLLVTLVRRWRWAYSTRDGVIMGCAVLLIPLYLLPMQ
jgi:hypothetical protein